MITRKLPAPDDIKLIVCDVDGTLLTSQHTIHPKTLSAIRKLRAAQPDLPIVIASGKQYNSCLWIREELGLPPQFPSAHCNGAILHGVDSSGKALHQSALSPGAVKHVVNGAQRFGTFVFTEDEALLVSQGEGVHKKDWCKIAGKSCKYDFGVLDCTQESQRSELFRRISDGEVVVSKVTICVDVSDVDAAKVFLDTVCETSTSPVTLTRAIPFIFEVIGPNVDKGTALAQICEMLGNVSLEQVLAFGDGENDIAMFERAGHAVAMGNAMPQAVVAAKYTTTSNNEGGVGQFIEQVWKL